MVVKTSNDLYYSGYDGKSAKPIFVKTYSKHCEFDEDIAKAIVKQLNSLGYTELMIVEHKKRVR